MGLEFKYVEDSSDEDEKMTASEEKWQDLEALQARHEELVNRMYREELLNYRFSELQELQDAENPNFVEEIITGHMEECASCIEELEKALKTDPVDYHFCSPVWSYGCQIGNSNASIGAHQVAIWCGKFRDCVSREDKQGCLDALEKVKEAFDILRPKLLTMLEFEREIAATGGTVYYMNCNNHV